MEAWQILRGEDADFYLTCRKVVRDRAGRHVADLLDAHPQLTERSATTWQTLRLVDLAGLQPQPPAFLSEGVPVGYATGNLGHGGIGKSQIELMRAVCFAAGIPFCGFEVERRPVTFLSCEDRTNILHWRLARICDYLKVDLASLDGWLHVIDLVGHDSVLFAPNQQTGAALTPAYVALAEHMRKEGSQVLVIDSITDTYGGLENDRGQIKRYVNTLLGLIPAESGGLILIGHVNKATAIAGATSEGYSGSTSWHNSMRARWYLYPETVADDEGAERAKRTGKLLFELQKSNHGETGTLIEFEWDPDAHLFVGRSQSAPSDFDRRHRDRAEQRSILLSLDGCAAAPEPVIVPAASTGNRTAYHVLTLRPEFPESLRSGKPAIRRFWRQIEAMRQMQAVATVSYRRANRHLGEQIVLTSEGKRQCAE